MSDLVFRKDAFSMVSFGSSFVQACWQCGDRFTGIIPLCARCYQCVDARLAWRRFWPHTPGLLGRGTVNAGR